MEDLIRLKAIPKGKNSSVRQEEGKINTITLISSSVGSWNPFESVRCIICWKTITEEEPVMECPYCHSKAHQDHMLRWLAKKGHCPVCRKKW